MELTKDVESLIHLIARAFGRASGNQTPEVHADVVLEHARALVAEDAQKVEPESATEAPAEPVVGAPQEQAAQ
jgi:hypothetical protein